MATLIYWQDPDTGALGVIRFDAVQSTSPEDTLAITDHPVEQGANVVDHAREEPTRLSIEGVVSTVPNPAVDTDVAFQVIEVSAPSRRATAQQQIELHPPQPPITPSVGGLIRAGTGALAGTTPVNGTFAGETQPDKTTIKPQVLQQRTPRNRVRDVYEALLRVQASRTLVQVSTRDREFFDMMLERVAEPRTTGDGSAAKFQVDFRRIRVSASQTVAAPKPTEARGKTGVNKGSQAAKKDEDPQQRRKTLAKVALDAVRGGS